MSTAVVECETKGGTDGLAASVSSSSIELRIVALEVLLDDERRAHALTAAALEAARQGVRRLEVAYARLQAQHTELEDAHAKVVVERDQLLRRFLGRKSEKERPGADVAPAAQQQELAFPELGAGAPTAGAGPGQLETAATSQEGSAAPTPTSTPTPEKKKRRRREGGRKKSKFRNDRGQSYRNRHE